jgi:hypothetical protein
MAKRIRMLLAALCLVLLLATTAAAEKPEQEAGGFDEWGYNYQAHLFNGAYCDVDHGTDPDAWCEMTDELVMKWNDAWLSNEDRDNDGRLDVHYGFESYVGSGAWLTNHISGEYQLEGRRCKWSHFFKIVAVPTYAVLDAETWYTGDGVEIGRAFGTEWAILFEVLNDPCAGEHGVAYASPVHPSLGNW